MTTTTRDGSAPAADILTNIRSATGKDSSGLVQLLQGSAQERIIVPMVECSAFTLGD